MDSRSSTDDDLETSLRNHAVPHHDKKHIKQFWTEKSLSLLLTKDGILKELQRYQDANPAYCNRRTVLALASTIFEHHRKVFAILVLLEKGRLILDVMEEVKDIDLPLHTLAGDTKHNMYRVSPQTSGSVLVQCLSGPSSGWTTCLREAFSKYQHQVSPEFLDLESDGRTPKHKTFHDDAVLPFMHETEKEHGGYGTVSQVEVHPDCHGFHNLLDSILTNDNFALKQLTNGEIEAFEREVKALKRFNGFDHRHMVTLLMSWTLEKRYYLLFPLAKCDLARHWENEPLPTSEPKKTLWMSKQVVGIASALEHIHDPPSNSQVTDNLPVPTNQYGRHGDLKPENILLYDSPDDAGGILVVADLGLAKINSILSRSQADANAHFTPRYKPPECNILDAKVTRLYDIWTFGCIILEWVCWMFEGNSVRSQFNSSLFAPFPHGSEADMYFDMLPVAGTIDYDVIVKPKVHQKFEDLHASGHCTQFFHDLLLLAEDEMIVVRSSDRSSSKVVHQKLNAMYARMGRDLDYYTKSCKPTQLGKARSPLRAKLQPLPAREKSTKRL
ncbi:kinase-like protein [Phaeosphaeriaceae sp. SRC1lsM3a]|nr:kinase-like protein [Stagonospora sp. SRC1lsM3a]